MNTWSGSYNLIIYKNLHKCRYYDKQIVNPVIWRENGLTSTPGNYGLLDQQMAIQFVRENAENIGGDATRITLMGESAGSWSVGYQQGRKIN